MVKEKGSAHY